MLKNIIFFIGIISLFGCAKTGHNDRIKNGICGSEIVADYNTMIFSCKGYDSTEEACKNSLSFFTSKYPGINCKIKRKNQFSSRESFFTINENHLKELIKEFEEKL